MPFFDTFLNQNYIRYLYLEKMYEKTILEHFLVLYL